jgi:hypothetical protein
MTRAKLLAKEGSNACISQFLMRDKKYELLEWLLEARNKGMGDPRDIWRYGRQKVTPLHGA